MLNDDAACVAAARNGDRLAMEALVRRHRPLLARLVAHAMGNADAAEDVIQDSLLQGLTNLDRLRQPSSFGPWLAGIGLNVARRVLRHALFHLTSALPPVDTDRASRDPTPEEAALAADVRTRISAALARLPPGQRQSVVAFYLRGLTYTEVAEELNIPVSAVRTRLHKARSRLRQQLTPLVEEEVVMSTETVEVRVAEVRRGSPDAGGSRPHVVVLEEIGGTRTLPIWVGAFEGAAIALQLEGVDMPRPMTHHFAVRLVEALGGRVEEVVVDRLAESTFYATVHLSGPHGHQTVDARPSDAISLALLQHARLGVTLDVLEQCASGPHRTAPTAYTESTKDIAANPGLWSRPVC